MILICVPDEPGFITAPASVTTVADCNHKVAISAAGVGILLTTPGVKTCCMFCIPPEEGQMHIPDEIREEYKAVMGEDIPPHVELMAEVWAKFISVRNRQRKP